MHFQESPYYHCFDSMQNQEFKDHPENFKSIGDFTLDGEGGSDISKSSAKKKPAGKANRQQSTGKVCILSILLACPFVYTYKICKS